MRSNADFAFHALEEFQQLLRLLGFVALVVLPDHLVGFSIDDDCLDRRGANIHTDGVDRPTTRLRSDLA